MSERPTCVLIAGGGVAALELMLALRGRRRATRVRSPQGPRLALPLYELALMPSTYAAARQLDGVQITLVTPEDAPLGLFGRRASNAIRALLGDYNIAVRTGAHPKLVEDAGCL